MTKFYLTMIALILVALTFAAFGEAFNVIFADLTPSDRLGLVLPYVPWVLGGTGLLAVIVAWITWRP